MICANCPNDAQFLVSDPGANPVTYCRVCLPPHLKTRAEAGDLALPEPEPEPVKKTRKKPAPAEEPPAEQ